MAWIQDKGRDGDETALAALFERVREPDGSVDNILRIHALHPAGLEAHIALYRAVMAGTAGLRKVDRELIAWAVSRANGCHY